MPDTIKYKLNGKPVDVPVGQVDQFKIDFPSATPVEIMEDDETSGSVKKYMLNGNVVEIPTDKEEAFIRDFPSAKAVEEPEGSEEKPRTFKENLKFAMNRGEGLTPKEKEKLRTKDIHQSVLDKFDIKEPSDIHKIPELENARQVEASKAIEDYQALRKFHIDKYDTKRREDFDNYFPWLKKELEEAEKNKNLGNVTEVWKKVDQAENKTKYFEESNYRADQVSNAIVEKMDFLNKRYSQALEGGVLRNVGVETGRAFAQYFKDYYELFDELKNNKYMTDLAKRASVSELEDMSPEEIRLIAIMFQTDEMMMKINQAMPTSAQVGEMTGHSMGFMTEFIVSGGVGSETAAAIRGTGKVLKGVKTGHDISKASRMARNLAAKLAQSGMQTFAMPSFYKEAALEVSKGEDVLSSVGKAYVHTFNENFSERFFFGKYGDRAAAGTFGKWMDRTANSIVYAKGWKGVVKGVAEEIGEEKIGDILNAPIDNFMRNPETGEFDPSRSFTDFINQFTDWEENSKMMMSTALLTLPLGAISAVGKKNYDKRLNRQRSYLPPYLSDYIDSQVVDENNSPKDVLTKLKDYITILNKTGRIESTDAYFLYKDALRYASMAISEGSRQELIVMNNKLEDEKAKEVEKQKKDGTYKAPAETEQEKYRIETLQFDSDLSVEEGHKNARKRKYGLIDTKTEKPVTGKIFETKKEAVEAAKERGAKITTKEKAADVKTEGSRFSKPIINEETSALEEIDKNIEDFEKENPNEIGVKGENGKYIAEPSQRYKDLIVQREKAINQIEKNKHDKKALTDYEMKMEQLTVNEPITVKRTLTIDENRKKEVTMPARVKNKTSDSITVSYRDGTLETIKQGSGDKFYSNLETEEMGENFLERILTGGITSKSKSKDKNILEAKGGVYYSSPGLGAKTLASKYPGKVVSGESLLAKILKKHLKESKESELPEALRGENKNALFSALSHVDENNVPMDFYKKLEELKSDETLNPTEIDEFMNMINDKFMEEANKLAEEGKLVFTNSGDILERAGKQLSGVFLSNQALMRKEYQSKNKGGMRSSSAKENAYRESGGKFIEVDDMKSKTKVSLPKAKQEAKKESETKEEQKEELEATQEQKAEPKNERTAETVKAEREQAVKKSQGQPVYVKQSLPTSKQVQNKTVTGNFYNYEKGMFEMAEVSASNMLIDIHDRIRAIESLINCVG